MERRLNTGRLVRGHPWPPTAVSPVAKGTGQGQGQDPRGASTAVVRGGRWRQGVPQHVRQSETVRVRRNPDEVRLGASSKITRLQSALAVLGEDDAVERSALEAALKKAQVQAVIPPVVGKSRKPRNS